ncbi:MAG: hypothetical protein IH823_05425 [Candidatus Dadabacteria bacterium]|nr:hypothetical protein [Candidatus Dadabacteria bacterium]
MTIIGINLSLVVTYALVCILIGVLAAKKKKSDDYLIAGRKIGTFSFISSTLATFFGGSSASCKILLSRWYLLTFL